MEEKLKEKLQLLNKEKEELIKELTSLNDSYKIGIRNLDRINGAIFILSDSLGIKPEEEKEQEVSTETETESKH